MAPGRSLAVTVLFIFFSLLDLVYSAPAPSPSFDCSAPYVPLLVRLVDQLPFSEGVEFCSSAVGKYFTTQQTVPECSSTQTSFFRTTTTATITSASVSTETAFRTVIDTVTSFSTGVLSATQLSTITATVAVSPTSNVLITSSATDYVTLTVFETITLTTTAYSTDTDTVTAFSTTDLSATVYSELDLTSTIISTIDSFTTDVDTADTVATSTTTVYSTITSTSTTTDLVFSTTVLSFTLTAPAEAVAEFTVSVPTLYEYPDTFVTTYVDATVTVAGSPSTVTETTTIIDVNTIVARSEPTLKKRWNGNNFAEAIGIAETLVTDFCSCVATGPTSTFKAEKTIGTVCKTTIPTTSTVTKTVSNAQTVTTTLPTTITSTTLVSDQVTSKITLFFTVTQTQDSVILDTSTDIDLITINQQTDVPVTTVITVTVPTTTIITTTIPTTETITQTLPSTSLFTAVVSTTSIITVYTTITETSTSVVTSTIAETSIAVVSDDLTSVITDLVTATTTPGPVTVPSTATIGYVVTILVTNYISVTTGTTTMTTTPITTVTSTVTVQTSTTVLPLCSNPTPTFALQIAAGGGQYTGDFLQEFETNPGTGNVEIPTVTTSSLTSAAGFYLSSGNLYDTMGNVFVTETFNEEELGYQFAYLVAEYEVTDYGERIPCSISSTGQLSCSDGIENIFYVCDNSHNDVVFAVVQPEFGYTCVEVQLNVVDLCLVVP